MAMMAITVSNSISVNALLRCLNGIAFMLLTGRSKAKQMGNFQCKFAVFDPALAGWWPPGFVLTGCDVTFNFTD